RLQSVSELLNPRRALSLAPAMARMESCRSSVTGPHQLPSDCRAAADSSLAAVHPGNRAPDETRSFGPRRFVRRLVPTLRAMRFAPPGRAPSGCPAAACRYCPAWRSIFAATPTDDNCRPSARSRDTPGLLPDVVQTSRWFDGPLRRLLGSPSLAQMHSADSRVKANQGAAGV